MRYWKLIENAPNWDTIVDYIESETVPESQEFTVFEEVGKEEYVSRKKPRVYIAGPISVGDLQHNINQATEAFIELAKAGFAPLCPHWSCFSDGAKRCYVNGSIQTIAFAGATSGQLTHQEWLEVDLPWVLVSSAVIRLPGESTGADIEVAFALENSIPVFYCTNLKETVREMAAELLK